jgi:hypothetical protein
MMMDAGKQPSANEDVELRGGVSPGNIHSFSIFAVLFPLHRDAVSCILRREAERGWQHSWAELFQANETDACYSHSVDAFWSKWARQESLEIVGIDTIIHQKTPINGAFEGRNIHGIPHDLKQERVKTRQMTLSSFASDYS